MYDPTTGRWLTEDPSGFDAGDANLYRYVGNGPTNAIDPEGLQAVDDRVWDDKARRITIEGGEPVRENRRPQLAVEPRVDSRVIVGGERIGRVEIRKGVSTTVRGQRGQVLSQFNGGISIAYFGERRREINFVQFVSMKATVGIRTQARFGGGEPVEAEFSRPEELPVRTPRVAGGEIRSSVGRDQRVYVDSPSQNDPRVNARNGVWRPTGDDGIIIQDRPGVAEVAARVLRDRYTAGRQADPRVYEARVTTAFTTYLVLDQTALYVIRWDQTATWRRSTGQITTSLNVISAGPVRDEDREALRTHLQVLQQDPRYRGQSTLTQSP
jgi:hypothetical protein